MILQADFTCSKCGYHSDKKTMYEQASEFVVDHILPIAMGGAEFDEDNLQVLCVECDKKKTAKDMPKIREYLKSKNNKKIEEYL